MKHPMMPTLYDEAPVTMPYDQWDRYTIWLHKQPLFLWQSALCMKIFGVNEFALRLPMAILGCGMVYAAYRSGKILGNDRVAFYSGLLMVSCFFLLELVSGRQAVDHNDMIFTAYISLSIWTWLEYTRTNKLTWVILTGIFCGAAILCKWLPGLLVYLVWGVYEIQKNKLDFKKYKNIALSFFITVFIALPWQLYIFAEYPAEAKVSYQYNVHHFLVPLDGHDGDMFYYFNLITSHYGTAALFLIVPALIIFLRRSTNFSAAASIVTGIVFVYIFYTIVQTKMPAFTFIAVLPVIISMGFLIDFVFSGPGRLRMHLFVNRMLIFLALTALLITRVDINTLKEKHGFLSPDNEYQSRLGHNKKIFKALNLPERTILFNVPGRHYVEAMFYTDYTAYNFIPSAAQYEEVIAQHRTIAVFLDDRNKLPSYMADNKEIIVLSEMPVGYE